MFRCWIQACLGSQCSGQYLSFPLALLCSCCLPAVFISGVKRMGDRRVWIAFEKCDDKRLCMGWKFCSQFVPKQDSQKYPLASIQPVTVFQCT